MKPKLTYDKLMKQHLKILKSLQYESGLFAASDKSVLLIFKLPVRVPPLCVKNSFVKAFN